jgi:hypothetical protein
MDLKEREVQFNKRWDIRTTDSYEEAFSKFKTRILNVFKDIDFQVSSESKTKFCQYYAIPEKVRPSKNGKPRSSGLIESRLRMQNNEKEFYRLIEIILLLDISHDGFSNRPYDTTKQNIIRGVEESIKLSEVNVSISIISKNNVILYPKGEELLDEELVDLPLSFLNAESAIHFVDALKFYESNSSIKSAESLRRTIEEFLKNKLENTKGLKENIVELLQKLKSDNRDPIIRNIIHKIFDYLDIYFNENSKHHDGDINEAENEFLIYQVGLLLRYINKV